MRLRLVVFALAASVGCGGGGATPGDAGNGGDAASDGGSSNDASSSDAGSNDASDAGDAGVVGTLCTSPVFTTSDPQGGWTDGAYYVFNDMWNTNVPLGPQTLSACSYHSWYVTSNQTDSAGAVKTYPNVQMNFPSKAISSFTKITSTFAETSPHVGDYEDAYDIWTNGIATNNSTEVMIWVDNFNQVPGGTKSSSATFGSVSYDVWRTNDGSYVAFVAKSNFTSGTIDVLAVFQWLMGQGWLPANATLDQIDFGPEICHTNGAPATWQITDFSIDTN